MRAYDAARFVFDALAHHKARTALSALGVAIGVFAVILLTSLGEGTRRYIVGQFTQFGTNISVITPGKSQTLGIPGVFSGTTHKLTVEDAEALRRMEGVETVIPISFGQARVSYGKAGRSVYITGVTRDLPLAWHLQVSQGSFLPAVDLNRGAPVAVLGSTLAKAIFGSEPPLGKRVSVGDRRFLVIGVLAPKGRLLGFDVDDTAYIPVASAMQLFNQVELLEIDLLSSRSESVDRVTARAKRLLTLRHDGNEDFTITSQNDMLSAFGRIMDIITVSVTAIAGISLFVGAMGILTIMWISVHERTAEIGLLRALGLTARTINLLFLLEAGILALLGGAAGLAGGLLASHLLQWAVPGLPLATPFSVVLSALAMSFAVGLLSGVIPARRAAALDPIEALREE